MIRDRIGRTAVPVAAAILAAATCVTAPAHAAARTIRSSDIAAIVGLSSPAIAPDGTRAVVIVSRTSWNDDKSVSALDLIDLATHARRTLTYERHGLASPAWSPDGTRLAFLADAGTGETAKAQVYVMPMNGGDARPVTAAPDGVLQFSWRPDGAAIAYTAHDAAPKRKGADRFRDAFVFTTEPITARAEPRPAHLWIVPSAGGTAKQLTRGTQSVTGSPLSWSPDGTKLAIGMAPNAIYNDADRAHAMLVDAATGALHPLTTHATFEGDARFSPDGKHIAYSHSAGDNQITLNEAYVTAPDGGDGTAVSRPFDRAVHDVAWLPDSSGILFTAHDGTAEALVRVPLGGAPARVDVGDLVIGSPLDGAIAKNGAMVFVASSTAQPPELFWKPANGAPAMVSDYNARIARLDLARSETVTYATTLGTKADALLVTPPGYVPGRRYPLVLIVHGGPTSASVNSFSRLAQLAAARGWLVLEPNYRGSDNLGLAYQGAVRYDPSEGPGKDIMAAVDAVRARGIVDDHRIAVSGWSYGGIMTAWMISKYHLWRAAVSGASVNDWATDYGVADDSDSDRALLHGSPYLPGNAEEWRRASAISYVHDVTTPVLIVSDIGDNRDPFATSSMYYRALRDNGKDATLLAYPVNGHFPADPVREVDVYEQWLNYIAKHF